MTLCPKVSEYHHLDRDAWKVSNLCIYDLTYQGKGKLLFFNRELEQVYQLAVSDAVGS